ncbi:Aste57867_18951 [Aphanomyces stellatus]|uniref:NADH:ubiquinone reductase (non-electrogenic) n=1 Tax=Aphanomyces stellatus TaxID=120398 RepID=A0A485LFN0_9STRA|nr:hypothetical protein As57867_018887 [Aphanomyces stellatus]VFT95681.1 Aste57867_18951 [Aphanomyces stellatus]
MRSILYRSSTRLLLPALVVGATAATALSKSSPASEKPPVAIAADASKHQLVVIGSGWGAVSFLRNMKTDASTQVTVVSPRGVFLYTPLLPAATTGTVEARSIVEPVRRLLPKHARFVEAAATAIDPAARTVTCESALAPGQPFTLPYDTLVVAVGSVANTFGVPGVAEHCRFLKSYDDVTGLRRTIHERWEQASLPTTTPAERARLLTFVICGGGPTGAELAAELQDLFTTELATSYPEIAAHARVVVVEASDHVLSVFDRRIAAHATAAFSTHGIDTRLHTRVVGVTADGVDMLDLTTNTKTSLPAATVVWATGVGLHPLARALAQALPATQTNCRALVVDDWLRVKGAEERIYALGDAASIEQKRAVDHAAMLFDTFDHAKSGFLELDDVRALLADACKTFPQFREHLRHLDASHTSALAASVQSLSLLVLPFMAKVVRRNSTSAAAVQEAFDAADKDGDHRLSKQEFVDFVKAMDSHLRAMPATAQVAQQQGCYLARMYNAGHFADKDKAGVVEPFHWKDMGSLAFIGADEAVASIPGIGVLQGIATGMLWRGFETSKQQSVRSRFAVATDQIRSRIFGRGV